ncbi:MAG: hypothetical protein AAB488_02320 [Patescibacteria group bacterium]
MLSRFKLKNLYKKGKSSKEISVLLGFSTGKINYWLKKYKIKKRSISDAVYLKYNPNGDPFSFKKPRTFSEAQLLGIGLGLYWGEGTKADTSSVRLGNTDPKLINKFIEFLINIFHINKNDMKFSLQIFNDISEKLALNFWTKKLNINKSQFYKTTISPSQSKGTYKRKALFGVLTVYYHNKKLRNLLIDML